MTRTSSRSNFVLVVLPIPTAHIPVVAKRAASSSPSRGGLRRRGAGPLSSGLGSRSGQSRRVPTRARVATPRSGAGPSDAPPTKVGGRRGVVKGGVGTGATLTRRNHRQLHTGETAEPPAQVRSIPAAVGANRRGERRIFAASRRHIDLVSRLLTAVLLDRLHGLRGTLIW